MGKRENEITAQHPVDSRPRDKNVEQMLVEVEAGW
jgi:hypothetical protein